MFNVREHEQKYFIAVIWALRGDSGSVSAALSAYLTPLALTGCLHSGFSLLSHTLVRRSSWNLRLLSSSDVQAARRLISVLSARHRNKGIRLIEVLSLPQINETSEATFPILDRNAGLFVAIAKFPGKPIGPV